MPSARAVGLAALAGALLATGPSSGARAGIVPADHETRTTTALRGPVRSVVVQVSNGAVTVRQGRTASVQVTKRWSVHEPSVTTTLKNGVLTVTGRCPGLLDPFLYVYDPVSSCTTAVVVTLAALPSSVRATSYDGGVVVAGVRGAVDVNSGLGRAVLQQASGGAVRLLTNGGAVTGSGLRATSLHVRSGSGDTVLSHVAAPKGIDVGTSGGDVTATQVSTGKLTVSSSTGSATLTDVAAADTSLIAESGAVQVTRARVRQLITDTTTGDVVLRAVRGTIESKVATKGGTVRLDDVVLPALGTTSGVGSTTIAKSVVPHLTVQTTRGEVRVEQTAFSTLDVTSTSGGASVSAARRFRRLAVETSGAAVRAVVPSGRYALRLDSSGAVRAIGVTADSRAPATIQVRTGDGDIEVQGR